MSRDIMSRHISLQIVTQFIIKQNTTQQKLFTMTLDKLRDVNPV